MLYESLAGNDDTISACQPNYPLPESPSGSKPPVARNSRGTLSQPLDDEIAPGCTGKHSAHWSGTLSSADQASAGGVRGVKTAGSQSGSYARLAELKYEAVMRWISFPRGAVVNRRVHTPCFKPLINERGILYTPKPGPGSNGEDQSKRDVFKRTGSPRPETKWPFSGGQEASRDATRMPEPVRSYKTGYACSEDNRQVPGPIFLSPGPSEVVPDLNPGRASNRGILLFSHRTSGASLPTKLRMAATVREGTAPKPVTGNSGRTMSNSGYRGDSRKDGTLFGSVPVRCIPGSDAHLAGAFPPWIKRDTRTRPFHPLPK